ncbi:MAG: LytTR family DNA-binding domain-containing protein [Coriobacteriales bacterium]|jgi:DNA-binding LytR/AlgR family response regulator|nr:LytTR family DNA-binding domain-containing protein [Coriobacteriales bacterium]
MSDQDKANPLRVAVCEDVDSEALILVGFIEESQLLTSVEVFSTGEAFLEVFTAEAFDLVFLDVYMGEITGVQVAERIRELDSQVVIVFTTTSDDFTRESYRLNAYKYMLKPIQYEDVLDALELAVVKRDRAQGATLNIISDGEPVSVPISAIEFVESRERRSYIVMEDGSSYSTPTTIDALEKMLPSPQFLRSHRSFIVNLDHVEDVDEDFVMDTGERAYIRVKDFRRIKHAYDDYLFNSVRSV